MELKDAIRIRKSTRKFKTELIGDEVINNILDFCKNVKPLYKDILVKIKLAGEKEVKCILPFVTKQTLVLYSEEKEGYLENAGFVLQQVDLYLKTLGIGSCWLGMGKPSEFVETDGDLKYVIMMTIGYPEDELFRSVDDFKRNKMEEITDQVDNRLECARLAPSSVNSQPWYFKHVDNYIHTFLMTKGLITIKRLEKMNHIDIGIALSHIYVENPNTFQFTKIQNVETIKDGKYMGSFKI